MTTRRLARRQIATSAGAGLLLSPFLSLLEGSRPRADATKRARRLMLFCSMGTAPQIWTPTAVAGESSFTFSASTAPLAAVKQHLVMIEGLASANPGNNHGAPDALTGLGHGARNLISVDQFIGDKLRAAGVNRPIPVLLLSADSQVGGGRSMFNRGQNLATIASPLAAYQTIFGGGAQTGAAADKVLKRRKSTLDLLRAELATLGQTLGAQERAKLELHTESLRQLENRITQTAMPEVMVKCAKPATTPSDSTSNAITANLAHMDLIVNAFACDITRVAAVQFGSDQTMQVNIPEIGLQGDQHGGFIHSGAPDFKNLIALERWLCQRFVDLIAKLKAVPEADGSGSLFDNTLVVWARDMGDAPNHNQRSMRFVLAGGAGGYLKTNASGRYLNGPGDGKAARHERVLLNLCEALGITDFTGFGDPTLAGDDKTPLSAISG